MDDAILALNGLIIAALAILIRAVWRLTERIARLEGRLNGLANHRDS